MREKNRLPLPETVRTGRPRPRYGEERDLPNSTVRWNTQKRLVVKVVGALVFHSILKSPYRIPRAFLVPASEGTARPGVDERRVAGHTANTITVCVIWAIWAATCGLESVGCMPRRGYDTLFKLSQVLLLLCSGVRVAVVRSYMCRWCCWCWCGRRGSNMHNMYQRYD